MIRVLRRIKMEYSKMYEMRRMRNIDTFILTPRLRIWHMKFNVWDVWKIGFRLFLNLVSILTLERPTVNVCICWVHKRIHK